MTDENNNNVTEALPTDNVNDKDDNDQKEEKTEIIEEKTAESKEDNSVTEPAENAETAIEETKEPEQKTEQKPEEKTEQKSEEKTEQKPGQKTEQRPGQRPQGGKPPYSRPGRPGGFDKRPMQKNPRYRKKFCRFCFNKELKINYRDPQVLEGFITERGKILPRRITGTCAKHQRELSRAIKQARILSLLPFVVK